MKTKTRYLLEECIEKFLVELSENCYEDCDYLMHGDLSRQMTQAAELVYDSSMCSAKFNDENR